MRYVPVQEFGDMLYKYKDATSRSERRIKLKLHEIDSCYRECSVEEREFADDIIKKFCELINLLDEQNEDERQALIYKYEGMLEQEGWVAYQKRAIPYETSDMLLGAFYDRFKSPEELPYAQISQMSIKDRKGLANSTLIDYVARIGTFVNSYLWDMPRIAEIWSQESGNAHIDPVLFTYLHLELILASFDTKDENGNPVKQKVNIRSALRKLNEFKREQET